MKNLSLILCIVLIVFSCNSSKRTVKTVKAEQPTVQVGDTITLSSEKSEYDIIIIEPGFSTWLTSTAKQKGYYSQQYLENKNSFFVIAWNQRVLQPQQFNSSLYELQIDYNTRIDYGYDVNYQLYNYFIYFQNKYKQNLLGGRVPTF